MMPDERNQQHGSEAEQRAAPNGTAHIASAGLEAPQRESRHTVAVRSGSGQPARSREEEDLPGAMERNRDAPIGPTVSDVMISFIWVEPILQMFQRERDERTVVAPRTRTNGPYGDIGSDVGYYRAYEAVREGADPAVGFLWGSDTGHHFWRYYLQRDPGSIDAATAWSGLVPLRWRVPAVVDTNRAFKIFAEILLYPFGLALLVNARRRRKELLEDFVDAAIEFQNGRRISSGARSAGESLGAASARLLTTARQTLLGASQPGQRSDAFTIATFARGTGFDPAKPVPSAVRLALQGLVNADSSWKTATEQPSEVTDVPTSKPRSRPGHVMYAARRGRAVWFPARFTARKKSFALGCYHRNLVLATTQTEALSRSLAKRSTYSATTIPRRSSGTSIQHGHARPTSSAGCGRAITRRIGHIARSDRSQSNGDRRSIAPAAG